MRSIAAILLILFLIIPAASATMWKDAITGDLYTSADWGKYGITVKNARVSVGDHVVIWNSAVVYVWDLNMSYSFGDIEGVWQGGNYMAVHHGSKVTFVDFHGNTLREVDSSSVKEVVIAGSWAAVVSNSTYIISLQNSSHYEIGLNYLGVDESRSEFLFGDGSTFAVWKDGVWKQKNLSSRVIGAAGASAGYFVLCLDGLHLLNYNMSEEDRVGGNAREIFPLENYAVLLSSMKDDEGKRYWIFSFYGASDGKIFRESEGFVYLPPEGVFPSGDFLIIADEKHVHLMNASMHLICNNTFVEFNASKSYLVGISGDYLFVASPGNVLRTLSYLGGDVDNDWIPNSKDEDADNDGMPNWWEEKYGLNPLNPGDRSGDPDGDGLTNYQEYLNGTNPLSWDTDGDGLSDGYEVSTGSNPLVPNYHHEKIIDRDVLWLSIAILLAILIILGSKKE